jgi:Arc/MetJ-type ribon-helix-helix transcriptional regulator
MAEQGIKRKKEDLHVTVSPYVKKKMDRLVGNKEFSSATDLTETALTEFLVRYEVESENANAIDILLKMLETPEGKAAFEKVTKEKQESTKSNIENPTKDIVLRRKVVFD